MKVFIRGVVQVGVVFLLSACASKKEAVLKQPRPVQAVEVPDSSKEKPEILEVTPEAEVVMPSPKEFVAGVDGKRDEYEFVGTVNFNLRKPDFVILHHTAQESVEQTIRTFSLPHTQVSAHYLIGKDGKVYQLLNDYLRAWHAGNSRWGKVTDMNSHSIGIELDNNGSEIFPPEQIGSLLILLDSLKANYRIPTENFIGHSDIAPTRKQDPSVHFPWKILADRGSEFGTILSFPIRRQTLILFWPCASLATTLETHGPLSLPLSAISFNPTSAKN